MEQQYPENSKALPAQLDLASQGNVDAALQRVSKTGRPAIALIQAGNASRLSAFFSARGRPGDQLLVMGINPGGLLSTVPMAGDVFRPALPYRLRVLLKDRAQFIADFATPFYGLNHGQQVSQGVQTQTLNIALMASIKGTLDCVTAFSETDFRPDMAKVDVKKAESAVGDLSSKYKD